MPKSYTPPTGRLSTKRRTFEEVVRDIRHCVYSVVRIRKVGQQQAAGQQQANFYSLGSGFFVSHDVFLTCNHVMNAPNNSHVDGDVYRLVAHTCTGGIPQERDIQNVTVGTNLHLFPDSDLALVQCPANPTQPYLALEYGDVPIGKAIGVAGYPLPHLQANNGNLQYDGLVFRVANGIVNSTYNRSITPQQGAQVPNAPVIEVNFMFVPGNSGGPIFDAETGRAVGFVHGFWPVKVVEKVEQITLINPLPQNMPNEYIQNFSVVYSLGIKLDHCRTQLEALGVTL